MGKIFKWGIAAKGLYAYIRHPQYLFLGVWGVGLVILWPRFIVLATLSLMFILYYFLAKDEERRMLGQHGDTYREYMEHTGMFFPFSLASRFRFVTDWIPNPGLKNVISTCIHRCRSAGCRISVSVSYGAFPSLGDREEFDTPAHFT